MSSKKEIKLDPFVVNKIKLHFGNDISLSFIINELLKSFSDVLEERGISLSEIYKESAKNVAENIDVSGST